MITPLKVGRLVGPTFRDVLTYTARAHLPINNFYIYLSSTILVLVLRAAHLRAH